MLIFILSAMTGFALEWPSESRDFAMLFGQRGENYNDFSQGLVLKDAGTVQAAEYGKHLITIENSRNSARFPSTLGNAVILVHDDGLQTVYGNLQSAETFSSRVQTESLSFVGRAGDSAWCDKNALIFQVTDTEKRVFINPLLIMPPVTDTTAPQIQNVFLVNAAGQTLPLAALKTAKQGSYDLYADVFDRLKKGGLEFAPLRISVLLNGANANLLAFEVLSSTDKEFFLQNNKIAGSVLYGKKNSMYLGKITVISGKTELTLTARDISGNERTERFVFTVE